MMQSIIYSEGELTFDGCDFSRSSADVLVEGNDDDALIRNAILGDMNCEPSLSTL